MFSLICPRPHWMENKVTKMIEDKRKNVLQHKQTNTELLNLLRWNCIQRYVGKQIHTLFRLILWLVFNWIALVYLLINRQKKICIFYYGKNSNSVELVLDDIAFICIEWDLSFISKGIFLSINSSHWLISISQF